MTRNEEIIAIAEAKRKKILCGWYPKWWLRVGIIYGARWADSHPKNPWRRVSDGDLPKDGANILCYHWYDGPHYFQGYYIADSKEVKYELPNDGKCDIELVDSWMEIPKTDAKSEKVSTNYDVAYLQSKIDAHTKRMQENGLTPDKMLEECRGGDSLTWHKVTDGDLPKDNGIYLVKFDRWENPVTMFWSHGWGEHFDDKITHWMRIPEINIKSENVNPNPIQ